MERQINELSERFYNTIDNTDNLNRTILLTLYKAINDFFSLNKKAEYTGTLNELLKQYESKAYVSKGKSLTDIQIIKLELKRIKQEYENQKIKYLSDDITKYDNLNDNKLELKQNLLMLVEYYVSQLRIFKEVDKLSQEDIDFFKKRIAYIEILLNMKNGLYYETYLCFVDELERIEGLANLNKLDITKEINHIDNLNKQKNR